MKFYLLLASATLFVCGVSAQAQNLIQNGDFMANAAAYVTYPGIDTGGSDPANPADWTDSLTSGWGGVNGPATPVGNVYGPSSMNINTGGSVSAFAFGQHDPTISQTFSVVAGQSYALDYVAASRANSSDLSVIFTTVTDDNASNTVLFAQSSLLPDDQFYANTTLGFVDTTGIGNTFVADQTGSVTLAFTDTAAVGGSSDPNKDPDHSFAFSNVSVEAVPEPSTWILCMAGAALLLLPYRRVLGSSRNS